jgi:hypothetical protein
MQAYAHALQAQGVQPILTEIEALHRAPLRSGLSVFAIGNGYVVAATLETRGHIPPNAYT